MFMDYIITSLSVKPVVWEIPPIHAFKYPRNKTMATYLFIVLVYNQFNYFDRTIVLGGKKP